MHCNNGHALRGPNDRLPDGQCRHCDSDRQGRYRTRRRAAMELALALESQGVKVMQSEPPINLQQLAAALANGYRSDNHSRNN